MPMSKLRTILLALPLAAACSSANNNGNGSPDAPTGERPDGSTNRPDGSTTNPDGSTTNPDATIPPGSGFFTIPLSTPTGQDQGEFYTPTLTASGKNFLLDLDTGSTVTGIAGTGCTSCTGMTPLYSPGANATATGGSADAQYADNSGWEGKIYSDSVGLGGGSPDVKLDLVDIQTQSGGFFSGNEYQGILGMGPDDLLAPGTNAYPTQLFAGSVPAIMGFEFCPTDGTMWLGGFDASHATSAVKYTPILSNGAATTGDNAGFYTVDMTSMSLGTTSLGLTSATADGPIVDTGTSLFYVPNKVETALIKDLNANAAFKTLFPSQTLTDPTNSNSQTAGCVNAAAGTTDAMVDDMLPKLTFVFGGGASVSATPLTSYFEDVGGGQFCLDISGGGDSGNMIMGDVFIRGFVTVIDRVNNQVGFAPTAHCAAPAVADVATTTPRGRRTERGRGPQHHIPHAR